jgi:hypothetical protein
METVSKVVAERRLRNIRASTASSPPDLRQTSGATRQLLERVRAFFRTDA